MNSPLKKTFPFGNFAAAARDEQWREQVFPFDGNCRCSKKSDLTLKLDDGSTIYTQAALMKMASPVFESALECSELKELRVEKTSRDAWVVILNHLHPMSPVTIIELDTADMELLEDVAEQARKFDLGAILAQIDRFFCRLVDWENPEVLMSHFKDALCDKKAVAGIAVRFELPQSSAKLMELAARVVRNARNRTSQSGFGRGCAYCNGSISPRFRPKTEPDNGAVTSFLLDLLKSGSEQYVRTISQMIVRELLR